MPGAGTSTQNTNYNQSQQQSGQSNPWGPTLPTLSNIISGIGKAPINLTPQQMGAYNSLYGSALNIPNLGPTAAATVQGYFDPNFTNPYNNPGLSQAFNRLNQEIGSGIAGQFAAAGRDPSGNAQAPEAIARGEAQAEAPILAGQYDALLNAQQNAFGLAGQIPGLYQQGPGAVVNAANAQALSPLTNVLGIEGATLPIAGLGGSYSSQGTASGQQNTTNTASPLQDALMASQAFGNLFGSGAGASPVSNAAGAGRGFFNWLANPAAVA